MERVNEEVGEYLPSVRGGESAFKALPNRKKSEKKVPGKRDRRQTGGNDQHIPQFKTSSGQGKSNRPGRN